MGTGSPTSTNAREVRTAGSAGRWSVPGSRPAASSAYEFEHGLLVHYDNEDVGPNPGQILKPLVQPLGNLRFFLQRVEALGQDDCVLGVCGALDLSYTVDVDSSAGVLLNNHSVAKPEGTYTDKAADNLGLSVQASPSLTIDVSIKVKDRDDTSPDDDLGTVTARSTSTTSSASIPCHEAGRRRAATFR